MLALTFDYITKPFQIDVLAAPSCVAWKVAACCGCPRSAATTRPGHSRTPRVRPDPAEMAKDDVSPGYRHNRLGKNSATIETCIARWAYRVADYSRRCRRRFELFSFLNCNDSLANVARRGEDVILRGRLPAWSFRNGRLEGSHGNHTLGASYYGSLHSVPSSFDLSPSPSQALLPRPSGAGGLKFDYLKTKPRRWPLERSLASL